MFKKTQINKLIRFHPNNGSKWRVIGDANTIRSWHPKQFVV